MLRKFFVLGKYFVSKESKFGGESSDLDFEGLRFFRFFVKRRVFMLGMLFLIRSFSIERLFGGGCYFSFDFIVDFVFF